MSISVVHLYCQFGIKQVPSRSPFNYLHCLVGHSEGKEDRRACIKVQNNNTVKITNQDPVSVVGV